MHIPSQLPEMPVVTSETADGPNAQDWRSEVIARQAGVDHGRPTRILHVGQAIIDAMRVGASQAKAAQSVQVDPATVTGWKVLYSGFRNALAQAEAQYFTRIVGDLHKCQTKWGTPDPKALEILVRRFPEFQVHQTQESTTLSVNVTMSPEQVVAMHAYHCQSLNPVSETVTLPLELSESGTGNPGSLAST